MRQIARVVGLIFAASAPAVAQQPDSAGTQRPRWASGMSLGVPGYRSQAAGEAFTLGGNFTRVNSAVGADIALFTMPRAMSAGLLPVVGRGGLAVPLRLSPNVYLVPSGGLVLVTALGDSGGDGAAGLYAGGAFIAFGEHGTGLRVAYTLNRLESFEASIWHLEMGFVRRAGSAK
jgi:hypothetical protein